MFKLVKKLIKDLRNENNFRGLYILLVKRIYSTVYIYIYIYISLLNLGEDQILKPNSQENVTFKRLKLPISIQMAIIIRIGFESGKRINFIFSRFVNTNLIV